MDSFLRSSHEFSRSAAAEEARIHAVNEAQHQLSELANQSAGTNPAEYLGEITDYALEFVQHMSESGMPGAAELSVESGGEEQSIKAYPVGVYGPFAKKPRPYTEQIIDEEELTIESDLSTTALNEAQPDGYIDQDHGTRISLKTVYLCEDAKLRFGDGKNIVRSPHHRFIPGIMFKAKHKPGYYRLYTSEQDRFYLMPLQRLLPALSYSKLSDISEPHEAHYAEERKVDVLAKKSKDTTKRAAKIFGNLALDSALLAAEISARAKKNVREKGKIIKENAFEKSEEKKQQFNKAREGHLEIPKIRKLDLTDSAKSKAKTHPDERSA